MDVPDDAGVAAAVCRATREGGPIDVVVNSVGVGVHGLQEVFTADAPRRLIEASVFGMHRVNRVLLPSLEAHTATKG